MRDVERLAGVVVARYLDEILRRAVADHDDVAGLGLPGRIPVGGMVPAWCSGTVVPSLCFGRSGRHAYCEGAEDGDDNENQFDNILWYVAPQIEVCFDSLAGRRSPGLPEPACPQAGLRVLGQPA
jgi:hypothetical protein